MITLYPEDGVIVLFPRAGVMTVLFPMAGVLVRAAGMMALYLKAGMMTMIVLMTGYLVPAGLRATMFPVGGNTNRGAGMITIYLKAGVMTILFPLGGNTNRGVGDQDLFVDVPDKQGQVVPDGMLAIFRAIWDPGTDPACAEEKEIMAPPTDRYHRFGIANNPELKVSVDVEKAAGATPEEHILPYQELRKHVPEVRCQGGHDEDSKELALVKNNKHPVFMAWASSQITFCNQTTLA